MVVKGRVGKESVRPMNEIKGRYGVLTRYKIEKVLRRGREGKRRRGKEEEWEGRNKKGRGGKQSRGKEREEEGRIAM